MKGKKQWLIFFSIVLLLGGVLAACSGKETTTGDEKKQEEKKTGPQKGGTVIGAMDTAPSGQFNPVFYEEAYEANILDATHEALVSQNDTLDFIPSLAESWEYNEDQTEVTFKLREDVKWHDGESFTADDVVFTYKVLSSPGYEEAGGIRGYYAEKLLGYEEFKGGETTEFQGVIADDDHTVTFRFEEPNVKAISDASFTIIPEHIFSKYSIEEMAEAEESRKPGKVIGTGPFQFAEMVQSEQYVLKKNKDYWGGEPYLDSIVWKIVDQAVILGLLENGEIDFVADPNGFQAADYETVKEMKHVDIIEQPDFGYQILGFMVNHHAQDDTSLDPSKWTVNEKLKEQKVRQAIAYAVDRQMLIDGLLYGRGTVQNSPIATQFWVYDDVNPPSYDYDPEKAKELLDEAGYVDVDGDGFREDPDGEEWVLNLNYPLGNQIRERSAPIIEEYLEEIGINIDLRQPKEAAAYFEDIEKNAQDWDLYLLGWTLGSTDPDPSGLWNSTAAYNYSRWNNQNADKLLEDAVAPPDAFDPEYRKDKYSEWQVAFGEDLPALILYAQNKLYAHNSRLQGVDPMPYRFMNNPHLWYVSD